MGGIYFAKCLSVMMISESAFRTEAEDMASAFCAVLPIFRIATPR